MTRETKDRVPGGRKKRRVSGGSVIVVVLLGFFVVATGVIARRTFGISQARTLRALERQRDAVDASRVKLEIEIRDASGRARLVPIAEQRLHMYVPPDSQVIILQRKPK
jgi:cell division protein FtsL